MFSRHTCTGRHPAFFGPRSKQEGSKREDYLPLVSKLVIGDAGDIKIDQDAMRSGYAAGNNARSGPGVKYNGAAAFLRRPRLRANKSAPGADRFTPGADSVWRNDYS